MKQRILAFIAATLAFLAAAVTYFRAAPGEDVALAVAVPLIGGLILLIWGIRSNEPRPT